MSWGTEINARLCMMHEHSCKILYLFVNVLESQFFMASVAQFLWMVTSTK